MSDILMLAGRLPYPMDDGWRIRTFNLLQSLSSLGKCVDLLVFDEGDGENDLSELEALCRNIVIIPRQKAYSSVELLRGLVFATPFSVLNYYDEQFEKAYVKLTSTYEYQYIQVEDIVLAQYVLHTPHICKVLDMHNIESDLLQRFAQNSESIAKSLYARMTARKLEQYEMHTLEKFDSVLVCSTNEQIALEQKGIKTPVKVIPNGVESQFYQNGHAQSVENTLVFVGSMDYHANISGIKYFASKVLPLLKDRIPSIKVFVVGKNPPQDIRELADAHFEVTGAVADVRLYLQRGVVSIVPLLVGGGTRLKVLEAMAAGLPVVSTSLGAEGIAVSHNENILIGDTAEDFAASVFRLLEHPEERQRLSENARRFVEENYDWSGIGVQLKTTVLSLLGERATESN